MAGKAKKTGGEVSRHKIYGASFTDAEKREMSAYCKRNNCTLADLMLKAVREASNDR